jgi:putative flippase GtrA
MQDLTLKILYDRVELETVSQLFLFSADGATNVAISFMLFYVIYNYVDPGEKLTALLNTLSQKQSNIANIVVYLAGMVYIFVLNNIRPFQAVNNTLEQGDCFFILNIFCLALSAGILQLPVGVWLFPCILILFASIVIIMILKVICNRYRILNEQSSETTWVAV